MGDLNGFLCVTYIQILCNGMLTYCCNHSGYIHTTAGNIKIKLKVATASLCQTAQAHIQRCVIHSDDLVYILYIYHFEWRRYANIRPCNSSKVKRNYYRNCLMRWMKISNADHRHLPPHTSLANVLPTRSWSIQNLELKCRSHIQ